MAALRFLASIGLRQLPRLPILAHHFGSIHSPYISLVVRIPCKKSAMQVSAYSTAEDDTKIELGMKKCVPCNSKELRPMDEGSAEVLLQQVPGWNLLNETGHLKLQRSWKAKSFMKGLEFFKLIAEVAEAEGHHPNLHLINWNDVNVDIWTHAIGGLTENDFILAAKISALDVEGLLRKRVGGKGSSTS